MTDSVLILEPGDERAQKIAKAMASQTANDILNFLSEGQKSQTEITERLAIPFTTSLPMTLFYLNPLCRSCLLLLPMDL